jgi:hypothetical protein
MYSVRAEQVLEEILHPAADQRLHLLVAQQPEPIENIPALQRETFLRDHFPASDGEDGDVCAVFETRSDFLFESRDGHLHLDPPPAVVKSNFKANSFGTPAIGPGKRVYQIVG